MSTHPVVSQLTRFFSDLTRNSYLTGKHRLVASISPGTSAQDQEDLVALAAEVRAKFQRSPFTDNDFINETAYDITIAVWPDLFTTALFVIEKAGVSPHHAGGVCYTTRGVNSIAIATLKPLVLPEAGSSSTRRRGWPGFFDPKGRGKSLNMRRCASFSMNHIEMHHAPGLLSDLPP